MRHALYWLASSYTVWWETRSCDQRFNVDGGEVDVDAIYRSTLMGSRHVKQPLKHTRLVPAQPSHHQGIVTSNYTRAHPPSFLVAA